MPNLLKLLNLSKLSRNFKSSKRAKNKGITKLFLFIVITMLFLNSSCGLVTKFVLPMLNSENIESMDEKILNNKNITYSNYKVELIKDLAHKIPVMDRGTEYVITLISAVTFSILAYVFFSYLSEEHKKQKKRLEKSKKRKEPSYV
ncbi:hypothetical protein [Methanococcus voltae]|uniref:Uncharacterized protein n=1 Tax=Methanococcus voltae PS TaxID=523842 RepID=A0ABT2EY22_METVO|nr:hypothetical protein [Methanococcus voltae]MBP2173161.1 hypothetical protein [Methanococcus voltae]MCS3922864.1 hypothetical protein [Methanococcus voltae PS]